VGLIPLYATLVIDNAVLASLPFFHKRMQWLCEQRPLVGSHVMHGSTSALLSLVSFSQLPRILGNGFAPCFSCMDVRAHASCYSPERVPGLINT
jgi:hypothetical protein